MWSWESLTCEADRLAGVYGTVPPPWVVHDEHPYDHRSRSEGLSFHINVFWAWWWAQKFTEDERIAYFRRWPPPPCWLAFLIQAVWLGDPFDAEAQANSAQYFERTRDLGFGSRQDYERVVDESMWPEALS
jgi:hypothetical protein